MPRPPARAVYNVGPFALRGDNFSGVTIFRRAPESIGIPTVRRMEESDRRNRRKRTLDYSNRYYIATFWKFLAEDRDENHTRVVYALQTHRQTHTQTDRQTDPSFEKSYGGDFRPLGMAQSQFKGYFHIFVPYSA